MSTCSYIFVRRKAVFCFHLTHHKISVYGYLHRQTSEFLRDVQRCELMTSRCGRHALRVARAMLHRVSSQGTHRLIQTLPTPIYILVRRRQGAAPIQVTTHRSLVHSSQVAHNLQITPLVALHKCLSQATLRADSRPLFEPNQGYSWSSALCHSGRPCSFPPGTQRHPLLGQNTRRWIVFPLNPS